MLVILGNGGHAEEVRDLALEACWSSIELCGPGDDAAWLQQARGVRFALGVGEPRVRERLVAHYLAAGASFATLKHPRSTVSPSAEIGEGAVICAGAVVGPGVRVGRFALVNFNATLGHGCAVDEGAIVLPGANLACAVRVGSWATIGAGSQLLPKVQVGERAVVGSSSMVARDVPARHSAVGVPARVMRLDDAR